MKLLRLILCGLIWGEAFILAVALSVGLGWLASYVGTL